MTTECLSLDAAKEKTLESAGELPFETEVSHE
jgi:hypothetical protein